MKGKAIQITLKPFPLHQLEWLCEFRQSSRSDVIAEAIIVSAAEFKRMKKAKGKDATQVDKTLGG